MSFFAENKETFSQNTMTDNFSGCLKCCIKRSIGRRDWLMFGRSYSHCSVLFLNIVVTDSFSLLIPQELNYTVSPYNKALELSSATSSLQHHFTRQVIIVQNLCKWADTSNCLWTQHWAQSAKPLLMWCSPWTEHCFCAWSLNPGLNVPQDWATEHRTKHGDGSTQTCQRFPCSFLYLTPLLKWVTGNKICLYFPNIQVPSRNQSWVL